MPSQAPSPIAFPQSGHADPLHRGVALNFRERFFPLGTLIEVQSNQEAVLEAARLSFGRYGRPSQTGPAQFLIQLCVDPERHDQEPRPIPSYRALSHLFHIGCGEASFAIADLTAGCAAGFISPELVSDTSFFRYVFLECLFYVLVVHRSHTPVHCATVAADGRGVLICGPSGAGKTTLAYACAKSGMQIVSDDVVHLQADPVNGQVSLWGNPWTLRLLPDAVEIFPELTGTEIKRGSDHEEYLEIDVLRRFPGSALISCQPTALIFVARDQSAETTIHPLKKEMALRRLSQDIVLEEARVIARHQRVLQELAAIGAYELRYSGAPSVAVELIGDVLQQ
jgi:hypothetical protein